MKKYQILINTEFKNKDKDIVEIYIVKDNDCNVFLVLDNPGDFLYNSTVFEIKNKKLVEIDDEIHDDIVYTIVDFLENE
jgi:hypothetical protein